MFQSSTRVESLFWPILAEVVLLLIAMVVGAGIGVSGAVILTFSIWLSILGLVAVGAFLITRAGRPTAGAGAIVAAVAVWLAYFWRSSPGVFLWPVVFILGFGLVAYGTRQDTQAGNAWLLLLPRVVAGWAFLDNAQNDYTWAFNGGNFLLGLELEPAAEVDETVSLKLEWHGVPKSAHAPDR